MSSEASSSDTRIMSEATDDLLIESLETQVQDLTVENEKLRTQVGALAARLEALKLMLNSNILNNIFPYL